jgi:hypothetical protein
MEVLLLLCSALGSASGGDGEPVEGSIGTLWARDGSWGGEPYTPHEGDIILIATITPIFTLTFPLAFSWHPWHSAVIVRRTTGDLAMLECGGDHHGYAALRPPGERLPDQFTKPYYRPRVWVRRIKHPLTLEQSRELTTFAETQAYKPFTTNPHLAMFIIPGRPLPRSSPDRKVWFCSEMVTEALVCSGLVTPAQAPRPEALAPRDLFLDIRIDLSSCWEAPLVYSATDQPPPPGPPLGPH